MRSEVHLQNREIVHIKGSPLIGSLDSRKPTKVRGLLGVFNNLCEGVHRTNLIENFFVFNINVFFLIPTLIPFCCN